MSTTAAEPKVIRSTVAARLDRLKWSPIHTRMVCGLGAAWILGGVVEIVFGINAEGKSLEAITEPLTSTDKPEAAATAGPA